MKRRRDGPPTGPPPGSSPSVGEDGSDPMGPSGGEEERILQLRVDGRVRPLFAAEQWKSCSGFRRWTEYLRVWTDGTSLGGCRACALRVVNSRGSTDVRARPAPPS